MNVVIIWDNAVFLQRSGGGWMRGEITRIEDAAELLTTHLPQRAKVRLIYDPELLTTEMEEAPKGGPKIMALALNDRHPALASETLAWGFQKQWGSATLGYSTFLHTENSPGLLVLKEKLELDKHVGLEGAWPLLTPAMLMTPERARACVTLVIDGTRAYLAGFPVSGTRVAMKVRAQDPAAMWSSLFDLLKQMGVSLGPERRLPSRVKIFTTSTVPQLAAECSYWSDLMARNTVEVQSFDALASRVRSLPRRDPSNLLRSLPSDVSLNLPLQLFSAACIAAAITIGLVWGKEVHRFEVRNNNLANEQGALLTENRKLSTNQQEIANLKLLYGSDVGWTTPGRAEFLHALAEGVPTGASATDLAIGELGDFRVTGVFWSPVENATRDTLVEPVAQALRRARPSLLLDSGKTTFDAKSGRFSFAGNLNKE
jgi:hypothetical protein